MADGIIITIDRRGRITMVERPVYESEFMTLYEQEPEPPRRPWFWRALAWSSAFAWLAVLLWLDRYAA